MRKRTTVIIIVLALTFALMLSACAPAARRPMGQGNNFDTTRANPNLTQQRGLGGRQGATGDMGLNGREGYGGGNLGLGGRQGYGGATGDMGFTGTGADMGFGSPGLGQQGNMNQGIGRTGTGFGNIVGYPMLPGDNNPGRTGYNLDTGSQGNFGNNRAGYNLAGTTMGNERLERACEAVRGVNDANVVVSGNTAYCGVRTDATTGDITRVRSEVARRLKSENPGIETVYVSNENDFITRLRTIGDGMRTGTPGNNFTTELNDMVRNMTQVR